MELILALEKRFLQTATPRDLTLLFGGGPGDGGTGGVNHLAHEGMLKRVIGGHYGLVPQIGKLALESKVEAYNLPLGVISHLFRDIACGLPGTASKVGLGTFVDPRLEGGKIGTKTTEDLVSVVTLGGKELLYYKTMPISVAFIRGTSADAEGNITMERETLTQDMLAIATATKNSGGFVIAQVERIAERGSLNPRRVKVPGLLVDCVVVAQAENHPQNLNGAYNAAFSAEVRVPLDAIAPMPLDERKVIARRAAFELLPNAVPHELPHHAESMRAGVLLNGLANVTHAAARPHLLNALHEALACDVDKLARGTGNVAHQERPGRVAIPAIQDGRDVQVDDVPVLEHLP